MKDVRTDNPFVIKISVVKKTEKRFKQKMFINKNCRSSDRMENTKEVTKGGGGGGVSFLRNSSANNDWNQKLPQAAPVVVFVHPQSHISDNCYYWLLLKPKQAEKFYSDYIHQP